MKKLLLAPAVAIAITGLAAAPVIAAPGDTASETASTAGGADTDAPVESTDSTTSGESPSHDPTDDQPSGDTLDPDPANADEPDPVTPIDPEPDAPVDPAPAEPAPALDTINAKVSAPAEIAESDYLWDGVDITVTGLKKGDSVALDFNGDFTITKVSRGASVKFHYQPDEEASAGTTFTYAVTVSRVGAEQATLDGAFTITADYTLNEGTVRLAKSTLSVSEFTNKGLAFTATGYEPGADAVGLVIKDADTFESIYFGEFTVGKDGTFSGVASPTEVTKVKPGKYLLGASTELTFGMAEFTITADPARASLSVTPTSIDVSDFVTTDKGVTLTVKDCAPGADVRFQVSPKGLNVSAFDKTVAADRNGTAEVTVFGTTSDASAYVGAYSVSAVCGDQTLKGGFTVNADAKAGGSAEKPESPSSSAQLPRTGADIGGLGAGALLLLIGGATVVLTRRRSTGQSPTDI